MLCDIHEERKYAIFDMDGTLVDSMPYWDSLMEKYLMDAGVKKVSDEILEIVKPMTTIDTAEYFIRVYGLDLSPEQVAADINRMMEYYYLHEIPLKDGAGEYLRRLREFGVRTAVASVTNEELVACCLGRLGIRDEFDCILSCRTLRTDKRFPDIYLEAANRLGGEPHETVVYEDALTPVKTAKAAGFYVVALYDRDSDREWEEICEAADMSAAGFPDILKTE